MECPDITTLEQAEAQLPSSVLPINGLRRDDNGLLTEDAHNTIIDGLKSRGISFANSEEIAKVMIDLSSLLCSASKQYSFLMSAYMKSDKLPNDEKVKLLIQKNFMITDIISVSRRIQAIVQNTNPAMPKMVEGWQNMNTVKNVTDSNHTLMKKLARDRALLEGFTSIDLGEQQVNITNEKNKIVSNYLGMYGFLNLFAVGLILYVAASK